MIAENVSKTFWIGVLCRAATAAKGKVDWQVSATSTSLVVLTWPLEEGRRRMGKIRREWAHRFGVYFRFCDWDGGEDSRV